MDGKRPALTPGRLYSMMSAEFREARSRTCLGCAMPMVLACDGIQGTGANWTVEPLARRCPTCEVELARIVDKYSALYDMNDPTVPSAPASPAPSAAGPLALDPEFTPL